MSLRQCGYLGTLVRGSEMEVDVPLTVASTNLKDDEFLAALASCELPSECFRHGDHLRFAWLMLRRHPLPAAIERVRSGIRAFATHHGAPQRYHETMTAGWVKLLATHAEPDFYSFVRENAHQLNGDLLHRFWSRELLASEIARREWAAPDLAPLPEPIFYVNSKSEGYATR